MNSKRIHDITSSKNSRVREAIHLRSNRYRKQTGRTLVDGLRECRRAVEAGVRVHALFVDANRIDSAEVGELVEEFASREATILRAAPAVMERVGYGQRESACVAVVDIPRRSLDDLSLPDDACIAIVEGVEKPGNLGAILRSADGAGVSAVIAADPRTELFQPNVIRASLGTIFSMPVCTATTSEVLQWLAGQSFQLVAACVEGSQPYYNVDMTRPTAIVLGSEAHGLSAAWRTVPAVAVRLPMHGVADSLNVAATAAVLFYEVLRQRDLGKIGKA